MVHVASRSLAPAHQIIFRRFARGTRLSRAISVLRKEAEPPARARRQSRWSAVRSLLRVPACLPAGVVWVPVDVFHRLRKRGFDCGGAGSSRSRGLRHRSKCVFDDRESVCEAPGHSMRDCIAKYRPPALLALVVAPVDTVSAQVLLRVGRQAVEALCGRGRKSRGQDHYSPHVGPADGSTAPALHVPSFSPLGQLAAHRLRGRRGRCHDTFLPCRLIEREVTFEERHRREDRRGKTSSYELATVSRATAAASARFEQPSFSMMCLT